MAKTIITFKSFNAFVALLKLCVIALAAWSFILFSCLPAAAADERERPVNFIFLVDVSGSMVMKTTMVKGPDGKDITLFEALRSALRQMVEDNRLIGGSSRVSFITFGTAVTEKSDWPTKLANAADRAELVGKIVAPATLSADKHGDTYMGGALHAALEKARGWAKESDACTMTFIVMFTDGWDEPPAGAPHKVRDVAKQILLEKRIARQKVGVDTWQTRVVGLQRLPDSKAGTTTAKELASLISGEFIDVNSQSGGTVSDRIFGALKKTVESLKGEIVLGNTAAAGTSKDAGKGLQSGCVMFGNVDGNGMSECSFPVELRSCYAEEVDKVEDCSNAVAGGAAAQTLSKLTGAGKLAAGTRLASSLPAGSLTVALTQADVVLTPVIPGRTYDEKPTNLVPVTAHAHSNCPAGHFLGFFKMISTARVDQFVPYAISVPSRLVISPEAIKVRVKKPGFFFPESTSVDLLASLGQSEGARRQTSVSVEITPESAQLKPESGKSVSAEFQNEKLDASNINEGKPVKFIYDASKSEKQEIKMMVVIPAKQKPGRYVGQLSVNVTGDSETKAPSRVPIEIVVEPSAWEEVAPVAVPLIIVCLLVCALGIFLWVSTLKRQR